MSIQKIITTVENYKNSTANLDWEYCLGELWILLENGQRESEYGSFHSLVEQWQGLPGCPKRSSCYEYAKAYTRRKVYCDRGLSPEVAEKLTKDAILSLNKLDDLETEMKIIKKSIVNEKPSTKGIKLNVRKAQGCSPKAIDQRLSRKELLEQNKDLEANNLTLRSRLQETESELAAAQRRIAQLEAENAKLQSGYLISA